MQRITTCVDTGFRSSVRERLLTCYVSPLPQKAAAPYLNQPILPHCCDSASHTDRMAPSCCQHRYEDLTTTRSGAFHHRCEEHTLPRCSHRCIDVRTDSETGCCATLDSMDSDDMGIAPHAANTSGFERVLDIRFAAATTPTIEGARSVSSAALLEDPSHFIPTMTTPTLIVCDIGLRSRTAALALQTAGYSSIRSLSGGMEAWFDEKLPVHTPGLLTAEQYRRYDRQIKLPGVGVEGQHRLGSSSVAIVGVGGLGAPVLSYLAGSGVGRITVIDSGVVELSNLHRQTIYTTQGVGAEKAEQAAAFATQLNPEVEMHHRHLTLSSSNAAEALSGHDVLVVCTDSFETAHVVNEASVELGIPMVFGSVYRTEGQLAVFHPGVGGCYACLFPYNAGVQPLDCSIVGVLGPATGVIGAMQAGEVIRILTHSEPPSVGLLSLYNADGQSIENVSIRKNVNCAVCASG